MISMMLLASSSRQLLRSTSAVSSRRVRFHGRCRPAWCIDASDVSMWVTLTFPVSVLVVTGLFLVRAGVLEVAPRPGQP